MSWTKFKIRYFCKSDKSVKVRYQSVERRNLGNERWILQKKTTNGYEERLKWLEQVESNYFYKSSKFLDGMCNSRIQM